jgi:hypothetical protein
MINIDTFLKIGDQHRICEDYVISGTVKVGTLPLEYIILSDGCSKSNRTEMGARILCYMAQQFIRFNFFKYPFEPDYKHMGLWIIHNAEMMARNLGLNRDCLDATLIVSWIDWTNYPVPFSNIYMYGDGLVVSDSNNGIRVIQIDYPPKNAPYYLSYELDPARKAAYHDLKCSKIQTFIESDGKRTEKQWAYDSPTKMIVNMAFDHTILIASDGFSSFYAEDQHVSKPIVPIMPNDMAPGFINFKGKKGSYLQRRASKELRSLNKNGIFHFDDLSIGAYVYEESQDGNLSTKEPGGCSEVPK